MMKILMFIFATLFLSHNAMAESTLSEQQRAIIPIAAFTANGDMKKLSLAFDEGLESGLTVNEIREIIIQLYAYTGFPRSLNGLNSFAAKLEERKLKGIKDTVGPDATPLPQDYEANKVGNEIRNTLVKRDMSNNTAAYAQLAPVIDVYLKEHLFGDIFSRDVLNYQQRELVTISALAAMHGTEAQLKGHMKISLNVGFTKDQLMDFISILNAKVDSDTANKAQNILNTIK